MGGNLKVANRRCWPESCQYRYGGPYVHLQEPSIGPSETNFRQLYNYFILPELMLGGYMLFCSELLHHRLSQKILSRSERAPC